MVLVLVLVLVRWSWRGKSGLSIVYVSDVASRLWSAALIKIILLKLLVLVSLVVAS